MSSNDYTDAWQSYDRYPSLMPENKKMYSPDVNSVIFNVDGNQVKSVVIDGAELQDSLVRLMTEGLMLHHSAGDYVKVDLGIPAFTVGDLKLIDQAPGRKEKEAHIAKEKAEAEAKEAAKNYPKTLSEMFDQSKWWKSKDGWVKLKKMEHTHLLNTMAFLERNAFAYGKKIAYRILMQELPSNYTDDDLSDGVFATECHMMNEADEWRMRSFDMIQQSKLYREMKRRALLDD